MTADFDEWAEEVFRQTSWWRRSYRGTTVTIEVSRLLYEDLGQPKSVHGFPVIVATDLLGDDWHVAEFHPAAV